MMYPIDERYIKGSAVASTPLMVNQKRDVYRLRCLIGIQVCSTILVVLLLASFYSFAYIKIHHQTGHNNDTTNHDYQKKENLTTLYAYDPLSSTFSFNNGQYGGEITDWGFYTTEIDIDFNNYYVNTFSIGIQGGRRGTIVDFGTAVSLQEKYHYPETIGNGQGFASIHQRNQTLVILSNPGNTNAFQIMDESAQVFQRGTSLATARVQLGHIYVLRITDSFDPNFERIVKMIVTAYRPNESVTLRWIELT